MRASATGWRWKPPLFFHHLLQLPLPGLPWLLPGQLVELRSVSRNDVASGVDGARAKSNDDCIGQLWAYWRLVGLITIGGHDVVGGGDLCIGKATGPHCDHAAQFKALIASSKNQLEFTFTFCWTLIMSVPLSLIELDLDSEKELSSRV